MAVYDLRAPVYCARAIHRGTVRDMRTATATEARIFDIIASAEEALADNPHNKYLKGVRDALRLSLLGEEPTTLAWESFKRTRGF